MSRLEPLELPGSGPDPANADWRSWLDERARGQLRLAGDEIATLKTAPPGGGAILQLWNDAGIALGNSFAVVSLLSSVHPDPAVVEQAEAIEVEARSFSTDLYLDADVFAQLSSIDAQRLDDGAARMLAKTLRDFRRSGVDRDDEVREQVRSIDQRLIDLGQAFSRNIRDGRRTTRVPATALDGLPEDFVADHRPAEDGSVAISTEYPDTQSFLTFAHDPDARRSVARTFFDLAWPVNDAVLRDLLRLRHEKATLLGYASWPDYDAEVKMIGRADAIGEFVDRIAGEALDAGRREIGVLTERASGDGVDTIDLANWRYYFEAVKREQFGVDA
ncbi:MAG: M3 family metallopeptidase, partial [Marmoricola sp.]